MAEAVETTGEPEIIDRGTAAFFSPAVLMFIPAALLDIIGIILICFGLDDFGITDIIGIAIIGLWTYFRSQTMKVTTRAARRITKAAKWIRRLRWLRPLLFILEFIPYVGVGPWWTLVVYLELKYS